MDLREWFVREFERCGPRMNLIAYGVLRDGHRARDAVQEAALRVYQKLDTVRDDSSLSGYLFVTTRNVALDMLKKTNRSQPTEKLEPKSPTDSWRPNADELVLLGDAVRRLPLDYQEVLFYRYKEALNAKQIAERLGITHPNARARLSRAHRSLRREMGVG